LDKAVQTRCISRNVFHRFLYEQSWTEEKTPANMGMTLEAGI